MWRKLETLAVFGFISTIFLARNQTDALFRIKKFHTDAIKTHNVLRFMHKAFPLTFNAKLADTANKTAADYLHKLQLGHELKEIIPTFSHDDVVDNRRYFDLSGENAWHLKLDPNIIIDDDADEWPDSFSVLKPIQEWYQARAHYKWSDKGHAEDETNINLFKPFAQLVWSTTLTAGCGYAKDWETVVIVCRYQPMAILGKWKVMDLHVPKFAYKPGILPPQFQVTEKPEDLDESSSSGMLGQNTRETIIAEVLDYSWTDTPLD